MFAYLPISAARMASTLRAACHENGFLLVAQIFQIDAHRTVVDILAAHRALRIKNREQISPAPIRCGSLLFLLAKIAKSEQKRILMNGTHREHGDVRLFA